MSDPSGFPPSGPGQPSPHHGQPSPGHGQQPSPGQGQNPVGQGRPGYGPNAPWSGQDQPGYGTGAPSTGYGRPWSGPSPGQDQLGYPPGAPSVGRPDQGTAPASGSVTDGPAVPPTPPAARRGSGRTPWIIALVAVLLAVGGVVWGLTRTSGEDTAAGLQVTVTEQSASSAEEAVRRVAERLAAGEVDGAYESFAVTSLIDTWDQLAYLERTQMSGPQDPPNPRDPYFTSSFALWRLGQIASQFRYLAFSVTLPEEMADLMSFQMMRLDDDLTAQQVVEATTIGKLEGLTVDRVEPVARSEDERYQEMMAPLRQVYGADEIKEFGVLYTYGGQTWMGGATALRYDDRWLLWGLQSPLIGQESSGALTPATAEEFEDAVNAD